MRTSGWVSLLLSVLVGAACLPVTNQADGASCTDDDECKSKRCNQGFCGGSSCKLSDPSTCDSGWKCIHSDADPITAFFGADGSETCRPTCGSCPASTYCAEGGKDGETLCSFGKAPLVLSLEASNVVAGQPSRIVAIAKPPAGRITSCEWQPGDGHPSETTPGPELTHVYEQGRRTYRVEASCTDEGGRRGSATTNFEAGCQASTGACTAPSCCAETGFHCLSAPSGTGNVCRAPKAPTLTVTGPNPIPVYQSGEYVASVSGGEGELRSVQWSFSDSSFTRQGIDVKESFSEAGIVTLTAKATTTLDQIIEQTYPVTVCQIVNGRCSDSEPCCAPNTCKSSGTTMRCLP